MIYAAACVWVLTIVLLAWGVDRVWAGLATAKTLQVILFPGTLILQLGRIVALLITGAKVVQVKLPDAQGGTKTQGADWQPRLPIIGPMIVALLPMALLSFVIAIVGLQLGRSVLMRLPADQIAPAVPLSLTAFWDQLRGLVTLCQGTLDALRSAEAEPWKVALFIYLMACLTVRLAPLPGNVHGQLGAIVVLTAVAALTGTVMESMPMMIERVWPLLALAVGWLLLLLLGSLLVSAIVASARAIFKPE